MAPRYKRGDLVHIGHTGTVFYEVKAVIGSRHPTYDLQAVTGGRVGSWRIGYTEHSLWLCSESMHHPSHTRERDHG